VGQAARIARDALARPLPAVQEARLRCVLAWVLCTSGLAQDASAEAGHVLARPQLPGDLRDEATIAQLQALAGMPAEPQADRLAGAVLAARDHGDPVIAAARITRAVISWDKGRISQALESLGDAARGGTEVSADARHTQPLLALAAALVDLRRIDQADGILRAAGRDKLHGIASEAVPPILRARIHLAAGRLADAAAEAEAALATAQTLAAHGYAGVARSVLGMIALRRGDLAAAERHIASRPASMPQFAGIYARAETTLAQAQITEARRGPAAALSLVRDICAGLPAHRGLLAAEPAAAAWLIRVSRAAGDEELAATVARAAEALAGDNPGFGTLATAAAHALGLAHRDPGPPGPGRSAARRPMGPGVGGRRPWRPAGRPGGQRPGRPPPDRGARRIRAGRRDHRHGPHQGAAPRARRKPPPPGLLSRPAGKRMGQPDRHRMRRLPARRPGTEQSADRQPHVHQHPHRRLPPAPRIPQTQHRLTRRTRPDRHRTGPRGQLSAPGLDRAARAGPG
jgi:hypothetical protein